MKIGEFASQNQVTTKMLRNYDEMGLLRPARIDPETGYRLHEAWQSAVLNWIIILKNLGFSLTQVREMFSYGRVSGKSVQSGVLAQPSRENNHTQI